MTFNFAPWAIDGARSTSGLARLASYAAGGGRSGIVKPADLRVQPLSPNGNGLRITQGGAVVLNNYLTTPDEAYVVSNPATHTVLSANMPAPSPVVGYYLVCVVIGDPEFDQSQHPFMPAGPLNPSIAADYEYVRTVIIPCSSSTTRFEQLNLDFPAYALARLEIPPNTTTITSAMITDLRALAQPRSKREVLMSGPPANQHLMSPDWTAWTQWHPWVEVPIWATRISVVVTLAGIVSFGNAIGYLRVKAGPLTGAALGYDFNDSPEGERRTTLLALGTDVSAYAGQGLQLVVEGTRTQGWTGYMSTWTESQILFDVQFDEAPL